MPDSNTPAPASWSSRITFLLAAVGAAVGLGNVWKFPYLVGVNGGGAFVLVYIICAIIVAIPLLMGELLIGRRGRSSPPTAMARVAVQSGRSPQWSLVAWMGVIVGYLILSYYSVVAGWAIAYVFETGAGTFVDIDPRGAGEAFKALLASPGRLIFWHSIFMSVTVFIISSGVKMGIETTVKILMPALFIILLVLIGYGAVEGDLEEGLRFLFAPDFSKINGEVVLTAVGQAFFSIGVSMGVMMVYGAYVPQDISLTRSAFVIAGADTVVAILAGVAIFPLVFANGLDPAEGPGLIFVTLPIAFGQMPGGTLFGTLFFILLTFAALTSAIAVLEPIIAWAVEKLGAGRKQAAIVFGLIAWLIGLLSVSSFSIWSDVAPLGMFEIFAGKTVFSLIDYLTANIMMPLGALLIAVFVGWRMNKSAVLDELGLENGPGFRVWHFLIRVIAPIAILIIFLANLA